jgi:hypothetical protein
MDTELVECAAAATDGKLLGAHPFDITESNSGINEHASESIKRAHSKANKEIDTFKVAGKINSANRGLLKDKKNQHAVNEESLQKDSSHTVKVMKGNSLEFKQRSLSKIKTPLQPSLDLPVCTENSTLGPMKLSRSKNNSHAPDESKRNKLTVGKENSSREPQLEDSAFGPELIITTLKSNEHFPDKSQNNSQGQKEKSTSIMMDKNLKTVSKNDISLKQSSLAVNPVINGNWTTVSQSEVAAEHVTESKLQTQTITQCQLSGDISSTVDSAAEIKSKQALYLAKHTTEMAQKHVNVRKKSKCEDKNVVSTAEEKSSFVHSILAVLNSLAGKGKVVCDLFT